ncbi:cytochrome b5-like heme/steroid-binding-domain-containing protein [Emydomyces testavorans]|uniref:Cytochrome b5-like heme/steroid-binding-domain-containing protein n=1 Tax=Emydomyces testavorans TaxID=2070801 RepID=A0AAF0DJW8_9EURO|nr:cytochrome b5-like heme/steroid-binding-domain-containing protein [Emydomyces testavorans]
MGWVGFGALVVSVSVLPARDLEPSLPQSQSSKPSSKLANGFIKRDPPDYDAESSENTPRATPIPSPPGLNIPLLNLDESSAMPEAPAASGQSTTLFSIPSTSDLRPPPSLTSPVSIRSPAPTQGPSAPNEPSSLMPPPPRPPSRVPLHPPPSAASSLRVPPSRTPPASKLSSSTLSPLGITGKPQKSSRQVILEPGHSPLDWAALTSDPRNNLRGKDLPPSLVRVAPSTLKLHNGRKGYDAWTSYQGRVYNITPYLPFHPGGKGELLRGAGKDSEKLFMEVHPWVNWDAMLGECLVGILVSEHEPKDRAGALDEMD